jgi:putative endonuclease
MFTVYALSSTVRNYIYVGLTSNLENRIFRHNSGYEKTTKPYRPFELIYQKTFTTRPEARSHEKYLKSSPGKRFLKDLKSCGNFGRAGLP